MDYEKELSHEVQMNYQCLADQSMWESGRGGFRVSTGDSAYASFQIDSSDKSKKDVVLLGTFGGEASLKANVRMGIGAEAYVTGGSIDLACPLRVIFNYPMYIPVVENLKTAFCVDTSLAIEPTATLSSRSPDARVSLFGHADGYFSLKTNVEAFSKTLLDIDVHRGTADNHFTADQNLLSVSLSQLVNMAAGYVPLEYPSSDPTQGPIIRGDLNFPVINATGGCDATRRLLTAQGCDSLLGLDVDITNLITYIIQKVTGVPVPLCNELSFPSSKDADGVQSKKGDGNDIFSISLAYQLLDLYLRGELGFKQKFVFTPTPFLALKCTDGRGNRVTAYLHKEEAPDGSPVLSQPISVVPVGTPLWFYMPDTGSVKIEPTLSYDGTFCNRTSLYIQGGIHFDPVSLSLHGEIAGIALPGFDFKPVSEGCTASTDIDLITCRPTLSFAKDQEPAAPFCIVQQNPPMAAIGSLSTNQAPPYNVKNSNDVPDAAVVVVTTDKEEWPLAASTNPKVMFYWDGTTPLQVQDEDPDPVTNKRTRIRVLIESRLLVPGVHTLSSSVVFGDSTKVDVTKPLEHHSTVSFYVPHLTPKLNQILFTDREGNTDALHYLDVQDAAGADSGNGRGSIVVCGVGSGFAPDTSILLNGQNVPRAQGYSTTDTDQLFFRITREQLCRPALLQIQAISRTPEGQVLQSDPPVTLVVRGRTPTLDTPPSSACRAFASLTMALHENAARYRQGKLLGAAGQPQVSAALDYCRAQAISAPERMLGMLAP